MRYLEQFHGIATGLLVCRVRYDLSAGEWWERCGGGVRGGGRGGGRGRGEWLGSFVSPHSTFWFLVKVFFCCFSFSEMKLLQFRGKLLSVKMIHRRQVFDV